MGLGPVFERRKKGLGIEGRVNRHRATKGCKLGFATSSNGMSRLQKIGTAEDS